MKASTNNSLFQKANMERKIPGTGSIFCLLSKTELICMQRYYFALRTVNTEENPTGKHKSEEVILTSEGAFLQDFEG